MPKYKTPALSRQLAFQRQNERCYYCCMPMWLSNIESFCDQFGFTRAQARGLRCTAEHLAARCDGGNDAPSNIVAACLLCNSRRHKRHNPLDPETYRRFVRKRVTAGRWRSSSYKQSKAATI